MNKLYAIVCFILFFSQTQAQHLLEALEGKNEFISTKSATKSGTFKRNNCDNKGQGKEITFTSTQTHTYTSHISQEDADKNALRIAEELAQNEVNNKGQEYANANAKCIWNVAPTISDQKLYTPIVNGKSCSNVYVTASVTVYAASDISFHQAMSNAQTRGRQEIFNYLFSYTPTPSCVDNYTCQDHYEEEYLTSTQVSSAGASCPVGVRNTGTSTSYPSATRGLETRSWNGNYSATCTVRYYDYLTNNYKTENKWQYLSKYKTQKCQANSTPFTKYENNSLEVIYDSSYNINY